MFVNFEVKSKSLLSTRIVLAFKSILILFFRSCLSHSSADATIPFSTSGERVHICRPIGCTTTEHEKERKSVRGRIPVKNDLSPAGYLRLGLNFIGPISDDQSPESQHLHVGPCRVDQRWALEITQVEDSRIRVNVTSSRLHNTPSGECTKVHGLLRSGLSSLQFPRFLSGSGGFLGGKLTWDEMTWDSVGLYIIGNSL